MRTPNMLVAHPSVPVTTLRDLVDLAKAQPGQITFASAGFGSAPQIPTIVESGVPGFEVYEWNALYAPSAVAPAIVARLNTAMNKLLETSDVQQRYSQMGAEALPMAPADVGRYMRGEMAKWAKTVKEMGIKGE